MQKFVQATWDAKTISLQGAFDFLLFPLCCAFCLPPLLFLAALRGFLLEAERLAVHLTTLDGRASRTEWQWYVDRLHGELDESEVFDES